jgi:hypothetical protein
MPRNMEILPYLVNGAAALRRGREMAKARTKIIRSKRNVRRDWLIRLLSLTIAALAMLTGGCGLLRGHAVAPFSTHLTEPGEAGVCANYFEALDQAILEAGVADRQACRIHGFPYLRVNRFLASFADQSLSRPALTAWVDRLAALDRAARKAEIANLPAALQQRLSTPNGETDLLQAATTCGNRLRNIDLATAENLERLRRRATVPPSYSTTKSILGLYPLTALFVRMGIDRYHRGIKKTYELQLDQLPVAGRLVRYMPAAAKGHTVAEAAVVLEQAVDDPLGIPELTTEEQDRLFAALAPVWEIDVNGDYDRIGTPFWDDNPLPEVDTSRPRVFTLLSHTRFQDEILPQFNYVIWFPERPLQGVFDILGGRLDGLIWRVTLDRHGKPLIYDTIHNCGCYHMFFPGRDLEARRQNSICAEPVLVPQHSPDLAGSMRLVIRVASRTHYIERIYTDDKAFERKNIALPFTPYNELRSLPAGAAGRRSLFGPDGIVPGTERRERWLLWPTGVADPGAMRQWGNHAIAFIGRRHFDDPDLIGQLFAPAGP